MTVRYRRLQVDDSSSTRLLEDRCSVLACRDAASAGGAAEGAVLAEQREWASAWGQVPNPPPPPPQRMRSLSSKQINDHPGTVNETFTKWPKKDHIWQKKVDFGEIVIPGIPGPSPTAHRPPKTLKKNVLFNCPA